MTQRISQHTPTPWFQEPTRNPEEVYLIGTPKGGRPNGEGMMTLKPCGLESPRFMDNVSFILHAANAYDELVRTVAKLELDRPLLIEAARVIHYWYDDSCYCPDMKAEHRPCGQCLARKFFEKVPELSNLSAISQKESP